MHKLHIVCPLVGIGTLPPPSPFPPDLKGGGLHSSAGEGVGEFQFGRLEKSLVGTLSTLRAYAQFVKID
jgi:hypothetical protein